jgi:transcriptional regulator with XRE-family HTH domain
MARKVPIEKRVAARVRALREQQSLSQTELASLAGTHRSQVVAVERGDRAPTVTTVDAFARALGVPVTHLVQDDEPRGTKTPDRVARLALTLRQRGPKYLEAMERVLKAIDAASSTRS